MSHIQAIRDFFHTARQDKARHRDIAAQLGISEAELLAAHLPSSYQENEAYFRTIQLRPEWPELIAITESLGEVMALTRNESCVHEKLGVYRKVSYQGNTGLVLGGAIDLRIFYQHWHTGFAVIEEAGEGYQRSLQFFDASGDAVHKIFLKPQSKVDAYYALTKHFASDERAPQLQVQKAASATPEQSDQLIDVSGFQTAWSSLRDTHDFFGLLKKFGVSRTQALRLAPAQFAQQIEVSSARDLLESAAQQQVPIMVFVSNRGVVQIHSGVINKVVTMGAWINILDPGFNLHLREDHIAQAWIVKKPTIDGLVTSVELFDAHGDTIAMFFGERKPGKPELCEWRALIENLHQESAPCLA